MAKNRWFGTWVLATLSLLGTRHGRTFHSAETRRIKYARWADRSVPRRTSGYPDDARRSKCRAWWVRYLPR